MRLLHPFQLAGVHGRTQLGHLPETRLVRQSFIKVDLNRRGYVCQSGHCPV